MVTDILLSQERDPVTIISLAQVKPLAKERVCALCETPLPETGYYRCPYCRKMLCEKCAKENDLNCPDCGIDLEHFEKETISCAVCGTTSMKRGYFTCPECGKILCKICFGSYGGQCPDCGVDLDFNK